MNRARSADLLLLFLGLCLLSFHNLQNPADALMRLKSTHLAQDKRFATLRQALPLPHPARLATSLDPAPLAATAVHSAGGFAGQRAETAAEVQPIEAQSALKARLKANALQSNHCNVFRNVSQCFTMFHNVSQRFTRRNANAESHSRGFEFAKPVAAT